MDELDDTESTLSLVLFSGTDDRLDAAAILAVGAAAMGRPVNVFLQYWALDAFRKGNVTKPHGVAAEAGPEGEALLREAHATGLQQHWSELLGQAKEIGDVRIDACSLSMEVFGLDAGDLDPLVDGVVGVASFMAAATGPITFI